MFESAKSAIRYVGQDIPANRGSAKSQLMVVLFRAAQIAGQLEKPWSIFGRIYLMLYGSVSSILGIEIPWQVIAGSGLQIFHGTGLVVHYRAQLGSNCILRQNTTLGSSHPDDPAAPHLGDRVDVGCNACIIGGIKIGNDAVIGAGSVVIHDVPANAIVVGNPARVVRINSNTEAA